MKQFGERYRGRRVLLTGHTGFKGSWLATWLCELGAQVTGFGLAPESVPAHWDLLNNPLVDWRGDIRDQAVVRSAFEQAQPEIVFHLAAQALVRRSYRDPLESWSTNVMGTANVLEACRQTPSVRAVVVITTDKVYANNEWPWGYRENDRLGGHDPYSASKAASELVVDSYRKAFWGGDDAPLIASARAGNVIGGGDWSEDRLIPDLVKAVRAGQSLEIRSPESTRPWQHVLECLSGYLLLGQRLLASDQSAAGAWNFGPAAQDNRTVAQVLAGLRLHWPELSWHTTAAQQPHEANLLYLDCAQARARLAWQPVWTLEQSLEMTADWYRHQSTTGQAITREQLERYVNAAAEAGCIWIDS
ncbi:CDP-glucose 4,6-dehydratase [Pseudomonas agarici]|nr:CDP-glucose 4,6-dehydratase [Pseudomonas agarici]NWB90764.1 CDP-glucose 4,6-dehydratase [Pseudomonas agarici]NWC08598.1 CDP-glucose 4,6-dehydratase [Pseudomonas agarici]SEL25800.1 CDP-glucose 4,6-dehydratase [Pseudomonas agarici]